MAFFFLAMMTLAGCIETSSPEDSSPFRDGELVSMEKSILPDKIKGGWAGQVIGCAYGYQVNVNHVIVYSQNDPDPQNY